MHIMHTGPSEGFEAAEAVGGAVEDVAEAMLKLWGCHEPLCCEVPFPSSWMKTLRSLVRFFSYL